MFRLVSLAFWGSERMDHETKHHLHESPPSMTVPLVILALLSLVGGWVGLPAWLGSNRFEEFLRPSLQLAHGAEHAVRVPCRGAVVRARLGRGGAGGRSAWHTASMSAARLCPSRWQRGFQALHTLLRRKYYVDEIYDALFVKPTVRPSRQHSVEAIRRGRDRWSGQRRRRA